VRRHPVRRSRRSARGRRRRSRRRFEGNHRFARSLPLAKALDPDVLLYEMNDEAIPVARGGPVRAVVPGWYATDSVKWHDRVWFANDELDGVFQAHDYRLRRPGEPGPERRMETLPVHALITTSPDGDAGVPPASCRSAESPGAEQMGSQRCSWASISAPGRRAARPSGGPYARVSWEACCTLSTGTHEIACHAVQTQPDRSPANVRGYGNNAIHRVGLGAA